MKKEGNYLYTPPIIEALEFNSENGFAQSQPVGTEQFGQDTEGVWN